MRSILTIIIACLLLPSGLAALATEAQPQQRKKTATDKQRQSDRDTETLDFSGTGRPGQQTAGESRGSCLSNHQPIAAMLPASNSGKTVLSHPNFWVYFPASVDRQREIEFTIQDESRNDVWRSRSAVNSQTGYQSFSLPATEAPLQVGQWYRWYVKVYCGDRVASAQYVQGWINRVPLSPQLDRQLKQNPHKSHLTYGNNNIWYDAIDRLLRLYQRHPQNITLEKDWQNLIRAKGVRLEGLPSIGGERVGKQ